MAPFYGWDSTASRLQPLRGDSLLFTIQFPEIPGAHFIDLRRMKGCVDLGATQWFLNTGLLDWESSALTIIFIINHQSAFSNFFNHVLFIPKIIHVSLQILWSAAYMLHICIFLIMFLVAKFTSSHLRMVPRNSSHLRRKIELTIYCFLTS